MRYREFIEGIRMGARDLAAAPKKQYTIGLEFEVAVKDSYDRDFDLDGDDYDEDDEPSIEELYDEFAELWYSGESTFDFEQWFSEFLRYGDGLKTLIDNIEPRYGWIAPEDFIKYKKQEEQQRVQRVISRYGAENIKKAQQFAELFPDEESLNDNTEQAKNLIRFVYNDIKENNNYETDQEWQDLFDSMPNERLIRNAETALNTVRFIIGEVQEKNDEDYEDDFEEERYIYGDDEQTEIIIIDVEEDINDTEDVLQYFDTDINDLRDTTVDDWENDEHEEMMTAFSDYASSQQSGRTGKINYVKSLIKDIRKPDWKVVEDGTPGVDAEIVTGVMSIDEGIKAVRSVFELIESNEYLFTERATGLHINIGSWSSNEWNRVDWLKFLVVYRADKALEAFERQFNTYASDKLPDIISDLEANSLEAFYDNIDTVNSIVRKLSPKMSAVNLSKLPGLGHIEIRAPGGAQYHKKTDVVINQIQRAVRALEIASDPSSYKNQYIKKLHKMLNKQKEAALGTPVDRFFRQIGTRKYIGNDVLNAIVKAIRVSNREDIVAADKLYNMSVHNRIVSDLKRIGRYTASESVGNDIRQALRKYDTDGIISNSKFMKHILAAFPKTVQPAPRSQNEPAMSRDELRSLIKKSVASATQNRNNA